MQVFTTSKHSSNHCYLLALCLALQVYNNDKYTYVPPLSSVEDGHENRSLHGMIRSTVERDTGALYSSKCGLLTAAGPWTIWTSRPQRSTENESTYLEIATGVYHNIFIVLSRKIILYLIGDLQKGSIKM